jgi:hypothetical protein
MKKFNKAALYYVGFASPLVLVLFIWGCFVNLNDLHFGSGFLQTLWDILGINLMVWIIVLLYLMIAMAVSGTMRADILARLAGIRERDERESRIAGEASKTVFLSTTAIFVLLLFLSLFNVKIGKKPADAVGPGEKRGYISVGLQFSVTGDRPVSAAAAASKDRIYLDYRGIPLSSTGLLLLLLLWQIGLYHYSAKRSLLSD